MSQSEPLVCAVMLTRDRPAMARRAVESFKAQTYEPKLLLIWDTSTPNSGMSSISGLSWTVEDIRVATRNQGQALGALRNDANAHLRADIIVHWDDDDWSHPNRIAEQVALLQSSGADIVGYREMLFWDTRCPQCKYGELLRLADGGWTCRTGGCELSGGGQLPGKAWLYSHPHPSYCVGTSLCYWRRTWEARKFRDISNGEEHWFCEGRKCISESSLKSDGARMIARIHGGNTSPNYDMEALIARGSREWKRVPEWDEYCRERMKL